MNKQSRIELIVGFFVILGLVIIAFMVFFISGVYMFQQGYNIKVTFSTVCNLNKGAAVRLAGIPVGVVKDLSIYYQQADGKPVVKADIFIDKGVEIRSNSKVALQGIYGISTPFIEIEPGEGKEFPLLKEGDIVTGIDPVPIELLVGRGKQILEDLGETISMVNSGIKDPEVQKAVRNTLIQLDRLTSDLTRILENNEGGVGKAIESLDQAALHFKEVMEKLDSGEGTVGKLLSDEALYQEIEAFVKDIKRHPWKLLKKGKEEKVEEESEKIEANNKKSFFRK